MATSTFHGLETARRAMTTHQSALHTTGHNIANANTPGYSRQRVNFSTTEAFPTPAFNMPNMPGQIGTGVKAGEVQRIREAFLDTQFRSENNKNGYWTARHNALEKMEDIMNEPTESGLASTMDRFWQSLQDLSVHPEDAGARSVVRQRGIAVAETFQYTYQSLQAIQEDYRSEIGVQQDRINSLIRQINNINKQISQVEPHGLLPNDLYDQRDLLVDELSGFMNVTVETVSSGGNASPQATGRYTIKLADEHGRDMGVTLVDGARLERTELHISYSDDGLVQGLHVANERALNQVENASEIKDLTSGVVHMNNLDAFRSPGALRATIETHGYIDRNGQVRGDYPEMMANLDLMVFTFVEELNAVHSSGWSLSEIEAGVKANDGEGIPFFTFAENANISSDNMKGAAQFLQVNRAIIEELDNIAASGFTSNPNEPLSEGFAGDGSNALALANVKDKNLSFGGSTTNVQSFYQSVIGNMAVDLNEANRMMKNTETLRDSVEDRRQSVMGVSLDEEMTNMIQFQHAYNAAARNITMIDEMLDIIINRMGVVGR
ncbi:flagellar hook-associated protein FlgK [Evansella cellulosilytica]|uniref:Flagellar hook-associated protein 1 n=1 Tax=Evansella cellulosilytica (strain ATCC 21833 / DSM 2522 / FERM P-1141 / JCM 9156 / N-4) TaxID=649639 RepID=E6TS97_EVAC2|nr:flagellar hook-associated protein FlgK [Evansella cellulosilytica]ADU31866.1 flagellar hook-associated protein FlgK [Evansella cellulosilytica DSM 2522]